MAAYDNFSLLSQEKLQRETTDADIGVPIDQWTTLDHDLFLRRVNIATPDTLDHLAFLDPVRAMKAIEVLTID